MKYYIVVLLFITLVVNSFAAYSGTPQMPKLVDGCYEIGTAEELYGFAQWSNESLTNESLCVKIVNDIELNSKVLTADFALNGKESDFALWTPINYFKGTLDGQNHVISGLVVVVKDAHASAGFINTVFGESEEQRAVIKNLGFVDSYVYGDMYVGGIVGHARHLTLDHVFHEGYVNGTTAVGGLIGLASQNNYILNSYNKGFVDSHYETGDLYASRFIGGLAGYIHTEKNLIRNCFSTAKISGVNYTGGLTGIAGIQTELSIENSFTTQDKLYGYEEGSAKVTLVNSFSLGKDSGKNVKTSEEFANGVVATILHNAQYGDIWGQNVGTDLHPVLTGKITNVTENLKLSKVTFHTYDGDTTTYATQYVVGYGLDFPTPERTGYRFDGWYAKADFSGNPLTRISDKETGDVDVYAKWLKYLDAKDGCYQIANADDLFVFAVMVDESDVDISCAKLTKDIVVNEDLRPLVAPLYNLWTINALPEILNGRLFISEAFINSMLTQVSANSSVLKSIDVNCYDSGNVDFMVSHQMGRFLIKGEIVECSHNNQKSILVFCINNKQVLSDGSISKIFSQLTMNVINKALDNMLNKSLPNGIKFIYGADVVTVDFKDFIARSILKKYKLFERCLADWVVIEKALVVDGGIELRLKF